MIDFAKFKQAKMEIEEYPNADAVSVGDFLIQLFDMTSRLTSHSGTHINMVWDYYNEAEPEKETREILQRLTGSFKTFITIAHNHPEKITSDYYLGMVESLPTITSAFLSFSNFLNSYAEGFKEDLFTMNFKDEPEHTSDEIQAKNEYSEAKSLQREVDYFAAGMKPFAKLFRQHFKSIVQEGIGR